MSRLDTLHLPVFMLLLGVLLWGAIDIRSVRAQADPTSSTTAAPVAEVKVAGLNIRSGPGTTYAVQTVVHRGDKLSVTGQSGNCAWLRVNTAQGETGWVAGAVQYVTLNVPCSTILDADLTTPPALATPVPPAATPTSIPPAQSQGATALVKVAALNVRNGPGTNYAVIAGLRQGDEVGVIGQFRDCQWLKVLLLAAQNSQGQLGWISGQSQFVTLSSPCNDIRVDPGVPVGSTPLATGATGRIQGKVFRSDTNAPISNVKIELHNTTFESVDSAYKIAETFADQQGFYAFSGVMPGDYVLEVTMELARIVDGPCSVSTGLFFYTGDDPNERLFVLIGQRSGGSPVFIGGGFRIQVDANEVAQKDLNLYCNRVDKP